MNKTIVDLRSDTVTKPTAGMRQAMANAEVGDDVIDVDPTVERLQQFTAELLGKESAIYMSSGSMTNQVAVRVHCKPGDEFLCEEGCHIYNYEQGAFAQLSGVVARTIEGDEGILQPEQLVGKVRPADEHLCQTRLVCLENTHNRGAGRIQPYDVVTDICQWAHEQGLRTHLDGARLFNAAAASGISAADWAQHFDTVSVCFSKGLGAPVGSALAGPRNLIEEARRHRKVFGGGMRQAGIIAAGALYALEHHRERLTEDHHKARLLAETVRRTGGITLVSEVDTNIVIFEVAESLGTAPDVAAMLETEGMLTFAIAPTRIRAVTHLDVDEPSVRRGCEILESVIERLAAGEKPPAHNMMAY